MIFVCDVVVDWGIEEVDRGGNALLNMLDLVQLAIYLKKRLKMKILNMKLWRREASKID